VIAIVIIAIIALLCLASDLTQLSALISAVTSAVAIIATILLNRRDAAERKKDNLQRQSKEEEDRRTKAVVLANQFMMRTAKILAYLPRCKASIDRWQYGALAEEEPSVIAAKNGILIPVVAELDLMLQAEVLGRETAQIVAQLFYLLDDFNAYMVLHIPNARKFTAEMLNEYVNLTNQKLNTIDKLASSCWEELNKIIDGQ
jgi:hypothetical protein